MQKWDGYRYVIALARCGSMTAAAKSLDTNTATVSRHIHRMTELYGTVLFVKKKTRWELTKEGDALVRVIEAFEKGLHDLDRANGHIDTVGRSVKIATVDFLCTHYLMPALGGFVRANEGLNIEFLCSDNRVSLAYGEADVSVRMSRPQEGRLVGRRTAELPFRAYRPQGSTQVDWIGLPEELDWTPEMRMAREVFGRSPKLRVQSYDAILRGAQSTGLCGILPQSFVRADSGMSYFPTEHPEAIREIWVIYHETRKMDPVVRLAADWVHEAFQAPSSAVARSVA